MPFEIEKKFLVNDYKNTFSFLKEKYGTPIFVKKAGFWWCNNYKGDENILDIKEPKILKKDVEIIKDLTELMFYPQDYQFLRIRVIDKDFFITFKNKSIVNNIEKNVEYEFNIDKKTLKMVIDYLTDNAFIFYYNIKETFEFNSNFNNENIKIELSKLDVLKDCYLEIELTGKKEDILYTKLNQYLKELSNLSIKEESRSYFELSMNENKETLKNFKLVNYSKNALNNLIKLIG